MTVFGLRRHNKYVKNGYLIEIRLHGPVKKYIKSIIYDVAYKFQTSGSTRRRPVPHITLYGPFSTKDTTRLVNTFKEICERYAVHNASIRELIPFNVAGFKEFNGISGKVICLDIIPSKKLSDLTDEICSKLNSFCNGQPWDRQKNMIFHTTIAFRDVDFKYNEIMKYLNSRPTPKTSFPLIRITLLRPGGKIFVEYDLIQNRLLNRHEAKSRDVYLKTISKVRNILRTNRCGEDDA